MQIFYHFAHYNFVNTSSCNISSITFSQTHIHTQRKRRKKKKKESEGKQKKSGVALIQLSITLHYSKRIFYYQY